VPIGGGIQLLAETIKPTAAFAFDVVAAINRPDFNVQMTSATPFACVCSVIVFNDNLLHF
jgi:hypothetical protein